MLCTIIAVCERLYRERRSIAALPQNQNLHNWTCSNRTVIQNQGKMNIANKGPYTCHVFCAFKFTVFNVDVRQAHTNARGMQSRHACVPKRPFVKARQLRSEINRAQLLECSSSHVTRTNESQPTDIFPFFRKYQSVINMERLFILVQSCQRFSSVPGMTGPYTQDFW